MIRVGDPVGERTRTVVPDERLVVLAGHERDPGVGVVAVREQLDVIKTLGDRNRTVGRLDVVAPIGARQLRLCVGAASGLGQLECPVGPATDELVVGQTLPHGRAQRAYEAEFRVELGKRFPLARRLSRPQHRLPVRLTVELERVRASCRPPEVDVSRIELERAAEECERLLDVVAAVGEVGRRGGADDGLRAERARRVGFAGPGEVGILGSSGLGVVVREHRRDSRRLRAVARPRRERGVETGAFRAGREASVRDLSRHRVLDHVLTLAVDRGVGAMPDEVAVLERLEVGVASRAARIRGRPECAADHGRGRQSTLSAGPSRSIRAARTAWRCRGSKVAGKLASVQVPFRRSSTPWSISARSDFLDEERLPDGAGRPRTGAGGLDAQELRRDQLLRCGRSRLGKRLEQERLPHRGHVRAHTMRPASSELRPRSRSTSSGPRSVLQSGLEEVEQRLVGPVQVLDKTAAGCSADNSVRRTTQASATGRRATADGGRERRRAQRQPEDRRDPEPDDVCLGRVALAEPSCSSDDLAQREVGDSADRTAGTCPCAVSGGRLLGGQPLPQNSRIRVVLPSPASPMIRDRFRLPAPSTA